MRKPRSWRHPDPSGEGSKGAGSLSSATPRRTRLRRAEEITTWYHKERKLMSQSTLAAPQLVINSRMIYSSWIPADPKAAAALLPGRLTPAGPIYMNQYVVDSEEQTSGFGAYSLTYMGLDLSGLTAPDGVTPARFFTNYFNSSAIMREYVAERG